MRSASQVARRSAGQMLFPTFICVSFALTQHVVNLTDSSSRCISTGIFQVYSRMSQTSQSLLGRRTHGSSIRLRSGGGRVCAWVCRDYGHHPLGPTRMVAKHHEFLQEQVLSSRGTACRDGSPDRDLANTFSSVCYLRKGMLSTEASAMNTVSSVFPPGWQYCM